MMKSVWTYGLIAIAIITLTTACNKNDTTTTPISPAGTEKMSDYFPSTIGTWWKYEHYDTDSNGVRGQLQYLDSTYINSVGMLAGKNAIEMLSTDLNSLQTDTTEYSVENSSLYVYSTLTSGITGDNTPSWILYLDLVKTKWTLVSIDTTIYYSGYSMKQTMVATVERTSNTTAFSFKGKTYPTKEFKMVLEIKASGEIPGVGKLESVTNMTGYFTLAKGLGMVKTRQMTTVVDPQNGNSITGSESIIIDSSIK